MHDGTQNRLVAVTVLLGAARRMVARDPAGADELLERAQSAAEQALAELRAVARGILPPVLADRGLAGALTGLAASCPVPCRIDVEAPERCAASVEATRLLRGGRDADQHRQAQRGRSSATVTVRSRDDRLRLDDHRRRPRRRGRGAAGPGSPASAAGSRPTTAPSRWPARPAGPTTLTVEPAMRIVIAEDDPLLREGLALLLRAEGLDVVATAGDRRRLPRRHRRPQARRRHRRRPDAADAHRRGDRRGRRGPAAPARPGRARAVGVRRAGLRHRAARRRGHRPRLHAQGTGRPGRGVPRRAAPGGGRGHGHRPGGRRAALHPQPAGHPAGTAQPARARRARR